MFNVYYLYSKSNSPNRCHNLSNLIKIKYIHNTFINFCKSFITNICHYYFLKTGKTKNWLLYSQTLNADVLNDWWWCLRYLYLGNYSWICSKNMTNYRFRDTYMYKST